MHVPLLLLCLLPIHLLLDPSPPLSLLLIHHDCGPIVTSLLMLFRLHELLLLLLLYHDRLSRKLHVPRSLGRTTHPVLLMLLLL